MKSAFLFTILFSMTSLAGGPTFSAFSFQNWLYVTILGDTCNHYEPLLKVDEFCREDRSIKTNVPVCSAEFYVISTKIGCGDNKVVPRIVGLELTGYNVAHEANLLILTYQGETIQVGLNR
jgi:hypothetical protein